MILTDIKMRIKKHINIEDAIKIIIVLEMNNYQMFFYRYYKRSIRLRLLYYSIYICIYSYNNLANNIVCFIF